MRDRNFLAEHLSRTPQPTRKPVDLTSDQQQQQAIATLDAPPQRTQGLVPLPELNTREMLAKSLLQQANDRSAHPLARGIAAYFGTKNLQDIAAEKGRTTEAMQAAELERERLQREEDIALQTRGLDIQESRAVNEQQRFKRDSALKERQLAATEELTEYTRRREERQDLLAQAENNRKAEIEQRKLQLDEQKARATIDEKQYKQEQEKLANADALVESEAAAINSISMIDDILEHPGLSPAVGFGLQKTSVFIDADINEPGGGFIAGSDAADFSERLRQLKGGAFLQARQQLKGGGSISDTESNKAEAAITRMSLQTSEKEFKKAAEEYRTIIAKGLERQKASAIKAGVIEEPEVITFEGFE